MTEIEALEQEIKEKQAILKELKAKKETARNLTSRGIENFKRMVLMILRSLTILLATFVILF